MLLAQLVSHFENKNNIFGSGDEDASVDDDDEGINRYFANMIDVHDSLHTKAKQISDYVKIDDNILNIEQGDAQEYLTEARLKKLKSELNQVHLKFVSEEQVKKNRAHAINVKTKFSRQLFNMKIKGQTLKKMQHIDSLFR